MRNNAGYHCYYVLDLRCQRMAPAVSSKGPFLGGGTQVESQRSELGELGGSTGQGSEWKCGEMPRPKAFWPLEQTRIKKVYLQALLQSCEPHFHSSKGTAAFL